MPIKKTNNASQNKKTAPSDDIELNRGIASLSYVWFLCLLPLLLRRDSEFAQFHAKQGLVLFVIELVGTIVFWIPIFGWFLYIAVIVVSIYGFFKALDGKYWQAPVISRWAERINL